MRIVVFGAPGVGKGSISAGLAQKWSIMHISTGNMLREQIAAKTKLGNRIEGLISLGRLVDDETMNEVVKATVDNLSGYILDGYPRSLPQMDYYIREIKKPDFFVHLKAPEEVLVERMLARGRGDDDARIIKARLATYESETFPILERAKQERHWEVVELDSVGSIEEVTNRLVQKIEQFQHKTKLDS